MVRPGVDPKVTIFATNLDVYYSEEVDVLEIEGEACDWRLSSALLAGVTSGLPVSNGKSTTLSAAGNKLTITSGRLVATGPLMTSDEYPIWTVHDISGALHPVQSMGARLQQITWAAGKDSPPYSGINFTGTHMVATDGYRIARVPCDMQELLEESITIPVTSISDILKTMGDTGMYVTESSVVLQPDDYTQISCAVYAEPFPDVGKRLPTEYPYNVIVDKNHVIEIINRLMTVTKGDRVTGVRLDFGDEEIEFYMEGAASGQVATDVIEVSGQCNWEGHKTLFFDPTYILSALSKAPNDSVMLGFLEPDKYRPLFINGGSGYEAWISPRKDLKPVG